MTKGLVSIIIPTKNSSQYLVRCLEKIKKQNYGNIETIMVDSGNSKDIEKITQLSKKYNCKLIIFDPKVKRGLFDATKKRNYVAKRIDGEFIYHVDADMEMTENVVKEAVKFSRIGFDAVILTEDSFGEGPWARAKNLERRFFWGDNTIESPRFFNTKVWRKLGGYDENIAGGGDDRDLYQKMLNAGYKVARTKSLVMHNEGKLTLAFLFRKQFMYKREIIKYIKKRPFVSIKSYFPIRKSHITHWKMFISRPIDTILFIIMKTVESVAGIAGIFYSLIE